MRRILYGVMLGVVLGSPLMARAFQSSYQPVTPAPSQPFAGKLDRHPTVALTFDDLPAAGSLPPGENRAKIATALAAESKPITSPGTYGFVNAVKLENDPDAQQALHGWKRG